MRDLGNLGGSSSQGYAIDYTGQIVGSALTGDAKTRAFLYSEGKMYDLNSLVMSGLGNATLGSALSISSHGQILATGCIQENCQPYLLDPIPPPADGGGGGCGIITRYGPPDPTLPLLLATALIAVLARSRGRGTGQPFSGK
jgi:probable HAF family extracellular repeat protein